MTSDEMTSHCKILKDASAASPVFVEEVPLSCYVTKHALTSAAQQLVNRLNQGIWGGYRYVLALYLNVAIRLSVGFE